MQAKSVYARSTSRHRQDGFTLVVVMMILMAISVLGAIAMQMTVSGQRSARNDRDMQLALQASESALNDAELDISVSSSTRKTLLSDTSYADITNQITTTCGANTANSKTIGLCLYVPNPANNKPVWLTTNFKASDANAQTVEFGTYTGATFPSGGGSISGIQSVQAPRYISEVMEDPAASRGAGMGNVKKRLYRITAMGFGTRQDIQAVTQTIYRP